MLEHLSEGDVDLDPFAQFSRWFQEATEAGMYEPNAMILATATLDGKPSARTVLLKGFDHRGFVFYTNYKSRKARELQQNPWASAVFLWGQIRRQVRIEGSIRKVTDDESDAYFASRPRGSQLGAWASAQSEVIPGRDVLEAQLAQLSEKFGETPPPRPSNWGGYRLRPETLEFWQGRPDRLHDRLRYRRSNDGGWLIERLSP